MSTLVIGLNWVGDAIMSFPALASAAVGFGHKIDILTRPNLAPLYELHPGVGRIWSVPTRQPFWRFLQPLRQIRARGYERILVLPQSFRAAWIAFLCGGRQRTGFATQRRGWLLHQGHALPTDWEAWHESRLWEHLTAAMGLPERHVPLPSIPAGILPPETTVRETFQIPAGPYAMLAPGAAGGPAKQWPLASFRHLATDILHQFGMPILATGAESDRRWTGDLCAGLGPRAIDLGGRTSLHELIVLLRGARFVIANDSGTMHLASLARTPMVAPIGATDPCRTGPLGELTALVHGPAVCPCRPCRKPQCSVPGHPCLASVTPDLVMSAVKGLLLRLERGGPTGDAVRP